MARKPMKPMRAWAVIRDDGTIPEIGSRLAVALNRNPLRGWKIASDERIARVLITEIPTPQAEPEAMTAASDDTATRVRLLIEQHMLDVTPRATYDPASVRVNAATLGEVFASMLDQARAEALEEAASVVLMTPLFKEDLTVKSSIERDKRMAAAIRALQGGSDAG